MNSGARSRAEAQRIADRIRFLRHEFQDAEFQAVLELTPEQLGRFNEWSRATLAGFYRWWWDWMPKYLFFAVIGAIGIALVMAFTHLRPGFRQGLGQGGAA
jgi:hypothetical protein